MSERAEGERDGRVEEVWILIAFAFALNLREGRLRCLLGWLNVFRYFLMYFSPGSSELEVESRCLPSAWRPRSLARMVSFVSFVHAHSSVFAEVSIALRGHLSGNFQSLGHSLSPRRSSMLKGRQLSLTGELSLCISASPISFHSLAPPDGLTGDNFHPAPPSKGPVLLFSSCCFLYAAFSSFPL
ncbi:hypothetical protein BDY24DRAFT_392774 [Mrakia frigida]|uniref:uncharacterized protein n=1 Tax=Mrakia frigida TaxID=29902 RepID=UPI003FCBFB86